MAISRRLSAIMFADIEGYTALMHQDEMNARKIRDKFQDVLNQACKSHHGKVAQFVGDGALCIFNSAIEAVQAAINIQLKLASEPRVPLRIGIHSGDVLFDGNNIYGNGVNIASRIESFAIAGSVLISGKVFEEIRNQKEFSAISVGKYDLKSLGEPIEIFAVSNPGIAIPELRKMKGKGIRVSDKEVSGSMLIMPVAAIAMLIVLTILLRDKLAFAGKTGKNKVHTIAVLPFTNLSDSKEQEYFADGICDQVLTQISKIGGVNVMSRTSTLQFRNTRKTIRAIASEIGADVLLEGTVQKSGEKVRINVQLIDAKSDGHLWAETYDREVKDVFAIQTDIASQIASALNTRLTELEISLITEKPTENLQAYDFYLRGKKYASSFWDYSRMDQIPQATRMFEQAIKLDPKFTAAYFDVIELLCGIYRKKEVLNSNEYGIKAKEWMDKMLALSTKDSYTHNAIAVYKFEKENDYEGALAELNLVDRILGSNKSTLTIRADILRRMGKITESIAYLKQQASLFPKSGRLWVEVAETFKLKREFDSCVFYINKAIEAGPDIAGFYMNKAMYHAELKGDLDGATSILRNAGSLADTNELKSSLTYINILKGNYNESIEVMLRSKDSLGILWQYRFSPNYLTIALLYRAQNKDDLAREYFERSYSISSRLVQQYPDDFRMHATLGIALAGLGNKEKALAAGNRARELMPDSRDAIVAVSPVESLALIHTLLGDQNAAIIQLEELLQMPFTWTMSNSVPLYKLHYNWKSLQNNHRFKTLIQPN